MPFLKTPSRLCKPVLTCAEEADSTLARLNDWLLSCQCLLGANTWQWARKGGHVFKVILPLCIMFSIHRLHPFQHPQTCLFPAVAVIPVIRVMRSTKPVISRRPALWGDWLEYDFFHCLMLMKPTVCKINYRYQVVQSDTHDMIFNGGIEGTIKLVHLTVRLYF